MVSTSPAGHEFFGSVWTSATFTSVHPGCSDGSCTAGSGSIGSPVNLAGGGQRVDFDTVPGASLNGFDFVSSAEPVFFDLFIDGVRQPTQVFFPSAATGMTATPSDIPFALTPG